VQQLCAKKSEEFTSTEALQNTRTGVYVPATNSLLKLASKSSRGGKNGNTRLEKNETGVSFFSQEPAILHNVAHVDTYERPVQDLERVRSDSMLFLHTLEFKNPIVIHCLASTGTFASSLDTPVDHRDCWCNDKTGNLEHGLRPNLTSLWIRTAGSFGLV